MNGFTLRELCRICETLPCEPAPLAGAWTEWEPGLDGFLCARRLETIDGRFYAALTPEQLRMADRDAVARYIQQAVVIGAGVAAKKRREQLTDGWSNDAPRVVRRISPDSESPTGAKITMVTQADAKAELRAMGIVDAVALSLGAQINEYHAPTRERFAGERR